MSHEKHYASYKSLAPKQKEQQQEQEYICMEVQNLEHRKKLLQENGLVCIYLHADWCEPCKLIKPQHARLAQQYSLPGRCLLAKENVDLELTRDYQITGIPAFIFYRGGRLVKDQNNIPVSVVGGDLKQVQQILDNILGQG